jgi:acetyl esterase/lipase
MTNPRHLLRICGLLLALVTLAACGAEAEPTATATPVSPTATPIPPTYTPVPPTDTPVPPTATSIPPTATPIPPTETPTPNVPPVTPAAASGSSTFNDIPYLPDWALDVFLPEGADGPYPTLLLLHGADGIRSHLYPLADYFTQRGYATVVPNWMGQLRPPRRSEFLNAFCSLAWLYSSADEYGFDPDRVVLFGHSAGGFAASVIGAADDTAEFLEGCPYQLPATDWTKGVVTYGGLYGNKNLIGNKGFYEMLADPGQLTSEESDELYSTLMVTEVEDWHDIGGLSAGQTQLLHILAPYWVDGSEPPFLLLIGERDTNIGLDIPNGFASLLQAAGGDAEVVKIPGADHEEIWDEASSGFTDSGEAMEAFLAELLE